MLSVDGIPSENGIFQEVSQEVKNLQEDIKTGKFKNAYLLFGEEAYLKIQYKEKLIHALNPDDDTMNFTKYEGKGIEVREMIDLCETMPFFADHRVVLVENSGFFKNKCDELADYMKTLPDYLRLVFVEEEVDKRSRMYKAVKNCGRIVEFAKHLTAVNIPPYPLHKLLLDKLLSVLGNRRFLLVEHGFLFAVFNDRIEDAYILLI